MAGTPRRLQLGIRARLFLLSLALLAIALTGATVYVSRTLGRDLESRARDALRADVEVVAVAVRGAEAFESARANALLHAAAHSSHDLDAALDALAAELRATQG